jgi:transcriptional regulator with XRE-family HTH domain
LRPVVTTPSADVRDGGIAVTSASISGLWNAPPQLDDTDTTSGSTRFRAYLVAEMRRRRWTQRYLAARSGVDHSTISRILTQTRSPSLETVERLRDALRGGSVGGSHDSTGLPATVRAMADALMADPRMDPDRINEVIDFYVQVRTRHRLVGGFTPTPAIRRIAGSR